MQSTLTGIVACGGDSSRMGFDKGLITYFDLPQRYHVYEMLEGLCASVYLSCNKYQARGIFSSCRFIEDDEEFKGAGPLSGVLTALKHFPGSDLLVVGCDYPFLTRDALKNFIETALKKRRPAAFFDLTAGCYIPVIAYYPSGSEVSLLKWKDDSHYSLQQFLKEKRAIKHVPADLRCLISIDDPEAAAWVKKRNTDLP